MAEYSNSPDPNFPDRPDHPNFYELAAIVRTYDEAVEAREEAFEELVEAAIDSESLVYLAQQRVLRAAGLGLADVGDLGTAPGIALWLDGFMAGVAWGARKVNEPSGVHRMRHG